MATEQSKGGPTITVAFNLFELKQRLQIQKGEEFSWSQIAREAGLHRNTVERIASNSTARVDLSTLAALISYFHSHGMRVGIEDLVRVEVEEREVA